MAIADYTNTPLSEMVLLKGRRAVVTGGGRGIGAGIVQRLAEAGASIVIGDVNMEIATATAKNTPCPPGVKIEALPLDLADEKSIIAFTDAAVAKLGGLDIWVNNAGYYPFGPVMEMDTKTWDKVHDINLRGAFFAAKEAATRMTACASKHAVIVNIASMAGIRGRTNMSAYIASKHGMIGFTKAMGLEFGPLNIRVLGIAPAVVVTPELAKVIGNEQMEQWCKDYPLGRPGVPDDIARVAVFCASDMSAFMTGSTITVEGGTGAGIFP